MKENNKLIAEFMGFILETNLTTMGYEKYKNSYGNWYKENEIVFHSDWNWLMTVVEKCSNIASELDEWEMYWEITDNIPRIDTTYNACVEFIKWYNEQSNE